MDEDRHSGKVEVNILLFAKAKELANTGAGVLRLPRRVKGRFILEEIICNWPSLKPLSSCLMLALNETYIDLVEEINLNDSDEIAVIPPLSGG
ncbi:molybdopterin synthase sulfur carrier subunit-like [Dendronephthya gigantea]|uniref:molybdopterin synthase sulfur carrier subunit-like n=1 Tax=Dendronephthya gigantea TaxID=151771 RepID=UPI00106CCC6D|nr:molybdopterin synthase sulfur carrier subunit-like [Dendronephthya gigantea]